MRTCTRTIIGQTKFYSTDFQEIQEQATDKQLITTMLHSGGVRHYYRQFLASFMFKKS